MLPAMAGLSLGKKNADPKVSVKCADGHFHSTRGNASGFLGTGQEPDNQADDGEHQDKQYP